MTPLLSRSGNSSGQIDRSVLEAAANWYVQSKGDGGGFDRRGLERWIAASEAHESAWQLVQQMDRHLGSMPAALALPALKGAQLQRRAVLKSLVAFAAVGTAGLVSYEAVPWRMWAADYRTGPGQQENVQLADGGSLDLNTDTAADVLYSASQRLVRLHAGEIMIQTAVDKQLPARPFLVATPQGSIRALGTRFSVRSENGTTRVAVFEHAVEVRTANAPEQALRVEAGTELEFSDAAAGQMTAVQRNQDAWMRGMLIAVDWRMADFLAELSRYRSGKISCNEAIADLRVTGAYRIDDIDAALQSLTNSHPVQIKYLTRLWAQVVPKG